MHNACKRRYIARATDDSFYNRRNRDALFAALYAASRNFDFVRSRLYPVNNKIASAKSLKFCAIFHRNFWYINLIYLYENNHLFQKIWCIVKIYRNVTKISVRERKACHKVYSIFPQQKMLMIFIIRLLLTTIDGKFL